MALWSKGIMHLSAAIPGGLTPGTYRGIAQDLMTFSQFLARDGSIGPLLHFQGKIQGERPAGFVTSPPFWKWEIQTALTGFQNGEWEKAKLSYVSLENLSLFVGHPSLTKRKYFLQEIYHHDLFQANRFLIMLPGGGTVVAFCWRILALGRWNLQMSRCKCPGVIVVCKIASQVWWNKLKRQNIVSLTLDSRGLKSKDLKGPMAFSLQTN